MASILVAMAQDVPYTASITSQPYVPLEEYSLLDIPLGWDDPEETLPIPFDMVIWGDTCTVLATANLGEMILGAGEADHAIAPVFSDICDVSPTDPSGEDVSEIRHSIEGVAPNRIFKIEYHNVGFYDEVLGGDSLGTAFQRANYQVWLHETGTITFHYGPNTVTDPSLVAADFINTAGLVGNVDFYDYGGTLFVAEGDADSPQFQSTDDIFSWFYSGDDGWGDTWPSEGTCYVFNPILPTGIVSVEYPTVFSAYPNPADKELQMEWGGSDPVKAVWMDIQGRIARVNLIQPGRTTIDVSEMQGGAYVLRIENGTAIRVLIQH